MAAPRSVELHNPELFGLNDLLLEGVFVEVYDAGAGIVKTARSEQG